jgi:3-oxoadipate enol-lactonase
MFIKDVGRGPVVVILHGCPVPIAHYDPLVERLASTHRVLVPELPGYGHTPTVEGPEILERGLELLAEELRSRGVSEAALVGHSLGAWRAMQLALSSPLRVTRIVSLGGPPALDDAARPGWAQVAQLARSGADLTDVLVRPAISAAFRAAHPNIVDEILPWLRLPAGSTLADELAALAQAPDPSLHFAKIVVPVLLRTGTEDGVCPPALQERYARALPNARSEVVASCGHMPLLEDRDGTISSVTAFLA